MQLRWKQEIQVIPAVASESRGVAETFQKASKAAAHYAQSVISKCGLSAVAGTPQTADALFDNLLTLEDRLDSLDEEHLEPDTSKTKELDGEFGEAVGE